MKTLIVTCIYSGLYNTELGGRDSRDGHYKNSLKSLLKMTEAKFVCFTSDKQIEDLRNFFYAINNFNESQIEFKTFDLKDTLYHNKIKKIKKIQELTVNDRCYEIQYSKFFWCLDFCDFDDYDNIFWFDAGLSHSGLIPPKFLDYTKGYWEMYFESKLFNNTFLQNLISFSNNKIVLCAKENVRNYWSKTLPKKYYKKYKTDYHIIGGFFGGEKNLMKNLCSLFVDRMNDVLDNESQLYLEENILTSIFYDYQELFNPLFFDIWWHEDDNIPGVNLKELTTKEKSFYKIIENLNSDSLLLELKKEKQQKINKIFKL